MSALADATLIQSAMESHQAEWLREGKHPRATAAVFGRLVRLKTTFYFYLFFYFFNVKGHDPSFKAICCKCNFQMLLF